MATNPTSNLSQENILRDVHDATAQTLRVSAFAVPPPGGIEVSINDVDDSIRIGDGAGHYLAINTDGSIKSVQLFTLPFDAITATYPLTTQEIYQSRVGGTGGTVQQTVTVNYTDSSKALILNVART